MPRKLTRRATLVGGAGLAGIAALGNLLDVAGDSAAPDARVGPQTPPAKSARSPTPGDSGRSATEASPTGSAPDGGTLAQLHDPDDWSGWKRWSGSVSVDRGASLSGDRALRIKAETDDSRAAAVFDFAEPQDLSRAFPTIGVKWRPQQPFGKTGVGLRLLDREGRKAIYSHFPTEYFKREARWQRLPPTYRPGPSDPDFDASAVRSVGVYHYTGGDYPATLWVGELKFVDTERERGAAMIHFDDESSTVYDTAFPIMEDHGVKGTFNVISRFIGTEGAPTVDELKEMRDAGWSIAAHPQYPEPIPAMDEARVREVFESEIEFLKEHDFTPSAMAWPYGRWDARSVEIAREYFDLAFAGGTGPHAAPPVPGSRMLYPRIGSDDVDKHVGGVDRAAARNGVTCLTYHKIHERATPKKDFADVVEHVASAPVDALTAEDLLDG